MLKRTDLRIWLPTETAIAGAHPLTPEARKEAAVLVARVQRADYRLAEALLVTENSTDFIQTVRTRIARGQIADAEALISEVLADPAQMPVGMMEDVLLDLARVHYQCGRWLQGLDVINRALALPDLSGLARNACLQVRSTCFFELAEFAKSLADIERIRSLRVLYPSSQQGLYSDVLEVKIVARLEGKDAGEFRWKTILQDNLSNENRNLNTALTLLRTRVDLNRLAGLPTTLLSEACLILADRMGDNLYAGLAWVDLCYGENQDRSREAALQLPALRKSHVRIDALLREIESGQIRSESIRALTLNGVPATRPSKKLPSRISRIFFRRSGYVVDLGEMTVEPIQMQERTRSILSAFKNGVTLSKDELFRRAWGLTFNSDRHDAILRNALLRVRKQTGATLQSRDREVTLKDALVLDV